MRFVRLDSYFESQFMFTNPFFDLKYYIFDRKTTLLLFILFNILLNLKLPLFLFLLLHSILKSHCYNYKYAIIWILILKLRVLYLLYLIIQYFMNHL